MLFQKLIAGPRHPSHTLPLGLPLMASYRREESLWSTWTSKPVFTLRYTNIHTHQRVYCMRKGEAVIGSTSDSTNEANYALQALCFLANKQCGCLTAMQILLCKKCWIM